MVQKRRRTAARRRGSALVLLLLLGAYAPAGAKGNPAAEYDSQVPARWYFLLYDRVKAESLSPPVASRIFGATGVALYQAVQGGMPENVSLVRQLNELKALPSAKSDVEYHWPSAANAALAEVLHGLFAGKPTSLSAFDGLQNEIVDGFAATVPADVLQNSNDLGRAIGQAVASWIASDGFARLNNCSYTPPVGPGLWRPTPPAFTPNPLQPCWGSLRPFVFRYRAECSPPPPPTFSTSPASTLYQYAREVYDTFNNLSDEQKIIARFWADNPGQTGTPPGHWIDIVRQISERQPLDLGTSAEAFARVGIVEADAFNRCWKVKYSYNLLRPVTYIRDQIDASFLPFLATPAFPEYTSGHSTQSGAVAIVLGDLFGQDYGFVDTTPVDHGTTPALSARSFASFSEAAEEAALSRLYGGIHYRFGNANGFAQGICIGHTILERVQFRRQH